MEKTQRVILYGNTLVLASIEASIRLDPFCELVAHPIRIDENILLELRPDVIIFDLDALQPEFNYSLAQKLPGLLLIGVDPKTNRALVWSGQKAESLSSLGLSQVIHETRFSIPMTGGTTDEPDP